MASAIFGCAADKAVVGYRFVGWKHGFASKESDRDYFFNTFFKDVLY